MISNVYTLTDIPLPPGMVAILDLRHIQVVGQPYRESLKEVIDKTGAVESIAKACNQDWLLMYAQLLRESKSHMTATIDSWDHCGTMFFDVQVHYFELAGIWVGTQ